jgi:hypothetical protein
MLLYSSLLFEHVLNCTHLQRSRQCSRRDDVSGGPAAAGGADAVRNDVLRARCAER